MLAAEKGVANGTKHKLYTEIFKCESYQSFSALASFLAGAH